jgi:hypothetical protein
MRVRNGGWSDREAFLSVGKAREEGRRREDERISTCFAKRRWHLVQAAPVSARKWLAPVAARKWLAPVAAV